MFVRFQCGCVGIAAGADALPVVIELCDGDRDAPRDSLAWVRRDLLGAPVVAALAPEAEAALHARLARRLALADRFDVIRVALGLPMDGGGQ